MAVAAAILVAAAVVVWRIHGSRAPANAAGVYSGDAAAVGIAVTLLLSLGAWWQKGRAPSGAGAPGQLAAAAARLAEATADRWQEEAVRRRIVTPAPVTVRWHWASAELAAPRHEVAMRPVPGAGPPPLPGGSDSDELLESGVVTRLFREVYVRLPHGRLVLLGAAGSGKTGSMILLLLAALGHRTGADGEPQAQLPVPVWLTLGGWNVLTESLDEWAAAAMYRDYPFLRAPDFGADAAGELLRVGLVTLFLDGLDELPDDLRSAALRRVDEARGLRIVLSSRPAEFQHALLEGRLDNAAVLELRPVRPAAAAAYLLHGQSGPLRGQWERVGTYLRGHPGAVAAQALDNPLTLSLARDAYAALDPAVLIEPGRFPTVAAFREHLIDQLLISAYPDESQRTRVVSRLAWAARHMGANRDLPWWDIPTWIPGWQVQVTRALGFGLIGALGFGVSSGLNSSDIGFLPAALVGALWGGISCGLAFGLAVGLVGRLAGEPHTFAFRRPRRAELGPVLGFGLSGMLGFGVLGWLTAWSESGAGGLPAAQLVEGVGGGLFFGLSIGALVLWSTRTARLPSATPVVTYRSDRRTAGILALISGFGIGLIVGLGAGPVTGVALGVSAALIAWLALGQVPLVKLTEVILGCHGHGQWRFLALLEDARDRQILRQAGAVYQFRHAALQDRLAATSL